MSLSPVEITTSTPGGRRARASVPITSSASTPLDAQHRQAERRDRLDAAARSASAGRPASAGGAPCIPRTGSSRNVLPGASSTTTMSSGSSSFSSLFSMLRTPSTAPVGTPADVVSGAVRRTRGRDRTSRPPARACRTCPWDQPPGGSGVLLFLVLVLVGWCRRSVRARSCGSRPASRRWRPGDTTGPSGRRPRTPGAGR